MGLAIAVTPALAQQLPSPLATPLQPSPPPGTHAKPPPPAKSAAKSAPKPAAKSVQGKPARAIDSRNSHPPDDPVAAAAFAALPETNRRAIQADLVWVSDYTGMGAEEIENQTINAIKAFQARRNEPQTGVPTDDQRAALAEAAKAPKAQVGWRLADDPISGARLGIPGKIVPRAAPTQSGTRWSTAQGQVQIETFSLNEASLPALFEQEKKFGARRIGYGGISPDSFLLIGEQGLKKFLVRAQARGGRVRGVTILFDQATEGTMATVGLAVADSFDGFPDPNGGPVAGRRAVEYANAVVIAPNGVLVTLADVTAECLSLTVPGFGHAELIAADDASNVALLRLYGAKGLAVAPLAADRAAAGPLTLVGVPGPSADAGNTTPVSINIRFGVEDPVVRPGLGGAAVVDSTGHVVGLVAPKGQAFDAAATADSTASLIPAATIRGFLQKQSVTPSTEATGAIGEAVRRVICVRK